MKLASSTREYACWNLWQFDLDWLSGSWDTATQNQKSRVHLFEQAFFSALYGMWNWPIWHGNEASLFIHGLEKQYVTKFDPTGNVLIQFNLILKLLTLSLFFLWLSNWAHGGVVHLLMNAQGMAGPEGCQAWGLATLGHSSGDEPPHHGLNCLVTDGWASQVKHCGHDSRSARWRRD